MIHETDIINAGLRMIGAQGITSLADGTDRAFDVGLYWQTSLEAFLEERHWSFAQVEARLQKFSESKFDVFGIEQKDTGRDSTWNFVYALPEDFLKISRIVGHHELAYQIRNYKNQLALYCDIPAVTIIYITKKIPFDMMSATAREALACRLAMFIDSARNGGANQQNLQQMYQSLLNSAIRLEPTTHNRLHIYSGEINRVRHVDESSNYRSPYELRKRHCQSWYLE